MKKSLIPVLAAVVAMMARESSHAQSANVNFQGGGGVPNMVDNSNTPLAGTDPTTGQTVRIGYFDTGFNVAGNAGNLQNLAAHWHLFSATNIRTIFGVPGSFAASASSTDTSFSGKQIDLWVFKTSDNLSPNFSTFANVQAYGLYTSSDVSWVFPPVGFGPGSTTSIDTSKVDQSFWGTINGSTSLGLAAVPEPSCLALLGLGLFGLICRRVRR